MALTAALIGLTIGVAATSKEVDEQVHVVSQEVKGWAPNAVFIRLNNTLAKFKQSLLNMQTCLLKRKCTKTQKKVLYATAGTVAALATIAVGVGIGSYIYAEHKRKKEAAAEEVTPAEPLDETKEVLELDEYFVIEPSWKSKFMQKVSKIIPLKNAQTTLKEAYDKIQKGIQKGVLKTKKMVNEAFDEEI